MVHQQLSAQTMTMSDLARTIRAQRQALRLTLQQLADMADCAKSYLSQIENDRRASPPSEQLLRRIEQALRLKPGELISRRRWQETPPEVRHQYQDMQRNNELAHQLARLARKEGLDASHASGELRRLINRFVQEPDHPEFIPLPVQIPIINKVAAGYPTEFTDLDYPASVADEYISTPDLYDPQAFAARVVGDSMEPEYHEGDVVVFSPERDTPDGSDCFVRLHRDNESTFKRIYFERDATGAMLIRLQPLNSAFPPRTFPREDVAGLYAAAYVVRNVPPPPTRR